jgi:hypothetical protein
MRKEIAMVVTVRFHFDAMQDYRTWMSRLKRELGVDGAQKYKREMLLVLSETEGKLPDAIFRATDTPATRQYSAIYQRTLLEYQVRTRKAVFGLFKRVEEIVILEI